MRSLECEACLFLFKKGGGHEAMPNLFQSGWVVWKIKDG